jgi:hypothetical protein
VRCVVRSVVSLQSISFERVKNAVTPNRFFKDWLNDAYLEISLASDATYARRWRDAISFFFFLFFSSFFSVFIIYR